MECEKWNFDIYLNVNLNFKVLFYVFFNFILVYSYGLLYIIIKNYFYNVIFSVCVYVKCYFVFIYVCCVVRNWNCWFYLDGFFWVFFVDYYFFS